MWVIQQLNSKEVREHDHRAGHRKNGDATLKLYRRILTIYQPKTRANNTTNNTN